MSPSVHTYTVAIDGLPDHGRVTARSAFIAAEEFAAAAVGEVRPVAGEFRIPVTVTNDRGMLWKMIVTIDNNVRYTARLVMPGEIQQDRSSTT